MGDGIGGPFEVVIFSESVYWNCTFIRLIRASKGQIEKKIYVRT